MRQPFQGSYPVTQPFGITPFFQQRRGSYPAPGHQGIDYGLPEGTPVVAPASGRLEFVDHGGRGWGYHAVIRERAGSAERLHILAHLARGSAKAETDADVRQGEILASSGATGFATGPHLHYEIRDRKLGLPQMAYAIDPRSLMPDTAPRFGLNALKNYAVQAAAREGLNPELFQRQINQESGWNIYAFSGAGAIGLAQIVPRWHPGVNPWDPHEALDYAARLMRHHLNAFGGRWDLALAAYNAGPDAVRNYRGIPPFPETRQYIAAILGRQQDEGSNLADEELQESQQIDRFLHLKAQELAERAIGIVNRAMAGLPPSEEEAQAVNTVYAALVNDWPSLWQIEKARRRGTD